MSDIGPSTPLHPIAPATRSPQPLDPTWDEVAGALLAPCTPEGTAERGRLLLAEARNDPNNTVHGLIVDDELIAVYILRRVSMANEVAAIAVAPDRCRRGHGRACLQDALRRSGRRPLIVDTDDRTLGFYQACGFKLIGRRTGPDETVRHRLGWHAPRPGPAAPTPPPPEVDPTADATTGSPIPGLVGAPWARSGVKPILDAEWVPKPSPAAPRVPSEAVPSILAGRTGWEAIVDLALAEDIGTGDVTTLATVPVETTARGAILVKSAGVVSGLGVAAFVFRRVDPAVAFIPRVTDGTHVPAGMIVAEVVGSARSLLMAERVALNLLQRLSGVATVTDRYVEAVAGTKARIIDTRKTTPGLRILEKAAVRDGGGHNHRVGLADGVLIKDNHLAALGGADRVTRALQQARAFAPHTLRIEVEVTTLADAAEAVAAGADVILLDNMDVDAMRQAVVLVAGRALLEASGGVDLTTVRAIAETGVDLISVGALTHSAPALDISLAFAVL